MNGRKTKRRKTHATKKRYAFHVNVKIFKSCLDNLLFILRCCKLAPFLEELYNFIVKYCQL